MKRLLSALAVCALAAAPLSAAPATTDGQTTAAAPASASASPAAKKKHVARRRPRTVHKSKDIAPQTCAAGAEVETKRHSFIWKLFFGGEGSKKQPVPSVAAPSPEPKLHAPRHAAVKNAIKPKNKIKEQKTATASAFPPPSAAAPGVTQPPPAVKSVSKPPAEAAEHAAPAPIPTPVPAVKPEEASRPAVIETPPAPAEPVPTFEELPARPKTPDSPLKERYLRAREEAASAPEVANLREKMASAPDGAPYRSAARAYVKALFSKLKAVDSGLGQSLDEKEAAYERRIATGKRLND